MRGGARFVFILVQALQIHSQYGHTSHSLGNAHVKHRLHEVHDLFEDLGSLGGVHDDAAHTHAAEHSAIRQLTETVCLFRGSLLQNITKDD